MNKLLINLTMLLLTNACAHIQSPSLQKTTSVDTQQINNSNTEGKWIAELQTKSGAIALSSDRDQVNPYFTNLAIWAGLKTSSIAPEVAERWINWYIDHINGAGPGLAVGGSIYDYTLKDGAELSTGNYDSVDSYAATFLMMVSQYYFTTHHKEFIDARMDMLLMVFDSIQTCYRTNYLTVAKPDKPEVFLMDNIEVWRGLKDFAAMMKEIGQKQKAIEIQKITKEIEKGIEWHLWSKRLNTYLNEASTRNPNFSLFYPDSVAPLWPIIFDLPDASPRRELLWAAFKNRLKKSNPKIDSDLFPWSLIAFASQKMGDQKTADEWFQKYLASHDHRWPWHVGESAGYFLYLNQLRSEK